MQLKLFVADEVAKVEKQVNEWLQSAPATVQHITQSQSERNGRFVFVTGIYYSLATDSSKRSRAESCNGTGAT